MANIWLVDVNSPNTIVYIGKIRIGANTHIHADELSHWLNSYVIMIHHIIKSNGDK